MNSGVLLGIFTGNHAGAEAFFEAGEYTIGSAMECDVALTDSTLAPRHCSFSLAADGAVRLSPLEGTVTLAGKSLSVPLDWPACAPALAGMVCLAWTRSGQGWTDMKLPSLLVEEASPVETQGGGTGAAAEDKTPARRQTEAHDRIRPGAKRSGRLPQLVIAGLLALCLIGLATDFPSSRDKSESGARTLEQILSAAGFPHLLVGENAGRVIISGLVPTEVDANKVRSLAAGQPHPIQVIVRTEEEFCNAILTALAGRDLFPQVRIENGEAVLLGYALDTLTESAALGWAGNAAPRVAPIRSALLTRSAVEKTLTTELDKAGLAGKITVDWRPGVIALGGEPADKNALGRAMEEVRGVLNSPIAFKLAGLSEQGRIYVGSTDGNADRNPLLDQTQASEQAGQGNPFGARLSLRGVSPVQPGGAGLPFITTSDGAVYFLGGILPSGHTLTGIYADRLEFSRNGTSMAYKLQAR